MRIGVYAIGIMREQGGMFQASGNMITSLYDISAKHPEDRYVLLVNSQEEAIKYGFTSWETGIIPFLIPKQTTMDKLRNLVGEGPHRELWRKFRRKFYPIKLTSLDEREIDDAATQICKQLKLDFIIFPNGHPLPAIDLPYITFIPDLQHKLQPDFPEVSENYEWYSRERNFRNQIRHATTIIVDSPTGKDDVLYYYSQYGVKEESVFVLPYLPYCQLNMNLSAIDAKNILSKYDLPSKFLFYPAQFWPHKNHIRIIEALHLIKQRFNLKIHIIFTGSSKGDFREENFRLMMGKIQEYEIDDQIKYLGYVTDDELSALYRTATALIMPTFFGPANIPVIEAWHMGCPVIYSNIRGLREQAGDAALLVDPNSVPDIADRIMGIWNNKDLQKKLISNGKKRISCYTSKDYNMILSQIIQYTKEHCKDVYTSK